MIVVAHNSAGPKEDIIVPVYPQTNGAYSLDSLHAGEKPVGFLASSVDEYVNALSFILSHEREMQDVSNYARERSRIFSTERFVKIMKDNIVQMLESFVCLDQETYNQTNPCSHKTTQHLIFSRIQMNNISIDST